MKRFLGFVLGLVLVSNIALAATVDETLDKLFSSNIADIAAALADIEADVTLKNAVTAKINNGLMSNQMVAKALPKGRIKLDFVSATGAVETGYMIIGSDGKVTDIGPGAVDQWAYSMTIKEDTLGQIMNSPDPANALITALNTKKIEIKARTITGKIKLSFLKISLKVYNIFFKPSAPAQPAAAAVAEICPFACEPPYTLFGPQTTPGACFVKAEYANKAPLSGTCPGELTLYGPNSKQGCGCQPVKPSATPCPARCDKGKNNLGESVQCVFEGTEMESLIGKTGVYCVGKTLTDFSYQNKPPVVCTC
ncbi:MAG: hypothetical protein ABH829_02200 [archaeon]